MKYIVNVSGGLTSYEALRRTIERYGVENTVGVFADTLIEDPDLYRFLDDQDKLFGITINRISDGRTPFGAMRDARCITMQGMAPCSRDLKRKVIDGWLTQNYTGVEYAMVFGMEWGEVNRMERLRERYSPVPVWFPLAEEPLVEKKDIALQLAEIGIALPYLYTLDFAHNNCGGGCVKAGQAHWAHFYRMLPERYAEWEREEEGMRAYLGKDIAILKERRGGVSRPVSLRAFRERIESGGYVDRTEWGGCGCFAQDEDATPSRVRT